MKIAQSLRKPLGHLRRAVARCVSGAEIAQLHAKLAAADDRECVLRQSLETLTEQHHALMKNHHVVLDQHAHAFKHLMKLQEQQADKETQHQGCTDPGNKIYSIFSLPKSAGQSLRLVLDRCRVAGPQGSLIPPSLARPNGLHVESAPSDALLRDFPQGGWFHSHAPASLQTIDFLATHRIRHIVVFRNPLDQLVAYRCHLVKHLRLGYRIATPWNPALIYVNPQAPISVQAVAEQTDMQQAFSLLIRSGYFAAVLDWIGRWSTYCLSGLSLPITYEELITAPEPTIHRVITFLDPILRLPAEGIAQVRNSMTEYTQFSQELDDRNVSSAYPHGYTGRQGIYRDYLTEQNITEACEVFDHFCRTSPYGAELVRWYPSLLETAVHTTTVKTAA